MQLHNQPENIAFPHGIGCFQDGGRWEKYEAMIRRFANLNPDMKVTIVEYGSGQGQAKMICVGNATVANAEDVEPEYRAEWWKHEPDAAIWWECPHGNTQVRGSPGPAPEGYYMDSEHTIPTPACHRPACVRYGKREYAKLQSILSESYWPEEEEHYQPRSHNAPPQEQVSVARGSDSQLADLTPEEREYQRLTTNNRREVSADPRGARCTHCFAAITVRGDPLSAASPTVTCTECARPCVVATSLIPGPRPIMITGMRTLMQWRKQGYPQRQDRSDPDKTIPLQAQSMQAGSDEGGKDQAATNVTATENFFLSRSKSEPDHKVA